MNQQLLQRLQILALHVPKSKHQDVAAKFSMSVSRLNQIRRGYHFKDPKKGEKTVKSLIKEYERLVRKQIKKLETILP